MAGLLNIRVDHCDSQKTVLTLNSKEDGGTTRMGSSLEIPIGRAADVKLPDFLLSEGELSANSDSESVDQTLERQGAQIKAQQAQQQASLVPADETDHHRMQELMNALHHEREVTRSLQEVASLVRSEFEKNLATANLEELQEIEQRHSVASNDDNPENKRSAIQSKFNDASISEQVDLYKSSKNALSEQAKREAANNFTANQTNLDRDARYTGDSYRGPDSTTDNNDTAQTREDEVPEEEFEAESNNPQQDEKFGYPGSHQGGGTTNQSKIEDRPVKMEDQGDQTDAMGEDPSTGDNKNYDEDDSHKDTQQKADEAVEEAKKAQEATSLSKDAAEKSSEAVAEEKQSDDKDSEEEPDDNFKTKANKLKVAQLAEVEEQFDNLDGEGTRKDRQEALKAEYDNADDDKKKELSKAVDSALDGE